MKTDFAVSWKKSKNPKKQRKFVANAPLHIKRKLLSARLSKDLAAKYSARNIPVRKGDKVKIAKGNYAGKIGKIDRVDAKKQRVFIEGTERTKTDNTKSLYPIHPSNIIIHELFLDDKRRKLALERRKKK